MGLVSLCRAPATLPPAKNPGIHDIAGWVGGTAGLDGECRRENLLSALVFVLWIKFLQSYCIDCAVLVALLPLYHAVIPSDIYICFIWKLSWNDVMVTWLNYSWVYVALVFEPTCVLIGYVCKLMTLRLVAEILLIVNASD